MGSSSAAFAGTASEYSASSREDEGERRLASGEGRGSSSLRPGDVSVSDSTMPGFFGDGGETDRVFSAGAGVVSAEVESAGETAGFSAAVSSVLSATAGWVIVSAGDEGLDRVASNGALPATMSRLGSGAAGVHRGPLLKKRLTASNKMARVAAPVREGLT